MRRVLTMLMFGFCAVGALPATSSAAPLRCPEARTLSGECVNPALTLGLRKQSIAMTQSKLSYTAPPRLPSEDFGTLVARDWNEMLNLFTFPPVTGIPGTARRP
jgi:hypothetical protein